MRPRALVTGAAHRVGRAIAVELAESGCDVAVHFHESQEEAAETVRRCQERGADAWAVSSDLGSSSGMGSLVSEVRQRWGALDVLVNNASLFRPCKFEELTDDIWREMLDVNLTAPFRLSRDLLPLLRTPSGLSDATSGPSHGVVIHLCDIGAERPIRGHTHYSVSKAGLVMLVRAMAVDLAPSVRTHGVSPGQVAWPTSYGAEKRAQLAKRIPMGKEGTVEDVARLIRFLVWEGHYLNGAVIPVDGGLSCRY